MFFTIVIIVLAIVGLFGLIGAIVTDNRDNRIGASVVSAIAIVLAGLIGFLSSVTTVEAKEVGVVTTFGKPSAQTLDSGMHLKKPWQKVTHIDATIQTDEYHGDRSISVILADKNTANISATIRWSVNAENASSVYADFRSDNPTESLRDAVVSTQFKAAVNAVFSKYDATAPGEATTDTLAAEVEKVMLTKTNGLVDIDSVTISYIKPGEKLQDKIEAIQAQSSQTTIASEKIETARKEAEANRILSDSISNDPNVLVSKCLDLLGDKAFTPPAGFSCWPGGNGAVVVPSK